MSAPVSTGLVRVVDVRFHPRNVRRELGDLRDLAASLARVGVIQPVVVERHPDYLLLRAGHRRVAAARLAGIAAVPAVIHRDHLSTDQFLVQALHENMHRSALDPADRARAIADLRTCGIGTTELARELGVTPNTVRAWALPADIDTAQSRGRSDPATTDPTAVGADDAPPAAPVRAFPSSQSRSAWTRARVHRELPGVIQRWQWAADAETDGGVVTDLLAELRALLDPEAKEQAA